MATRWPNCTPMWNDDRCCQEILYFLSYKNLDILLIFSAIQYRIRLRSSNFSIGMIEWWYGSSFGQAKWVFQTEKTSVLPSPPPIFMWKTRFDVYYYTQCRLTCVRRRNGCPSWMERIRGYDEPVSRYLHLNKQYIQAEIAFNHGFIKVDINP